MVKAMDTWIVVSEFEPQSRYYANFRTNTLRKGMKTFIGVSNGENSFTSVDPATYLGYFIWDNIC